MPTLEGFSIPRSLNGPFDANNDLQEWLNVIQDLKRYQSNPSLDVMLVQFLLIQVLNRSGTTNVKVPNRPLTVDGSYGEITERCVKHFQGNNTLQGRIQPQQTSHGTGDGVVSKAPSSPAGRRFTIYRLQWAMADLAPTEFSFLIGLAITKQLTADFLKSGRVAGGLPIPLGLQIFFTL